MTKSAEIEWYRSFHPFVFADCGSGHDYSTNHTELILQLDIDCNDLYVIPI